MICCPASHGVYDFLLHKIDFVYIDNFSQNTEVFQHVTLCLCWSCFFELFFSTLEAGVKGSRSRMFFKKGVLKSFAIFTGKHLCWSLFFEDFRHATLLKRDSDTGVFPWISFFKNSFFYRTPQLLVSFLWLPPLLMYDHGNLNFLVNHCWISLRSQSVLETLRSCISV